MKPLRIDGIPVHAVIVHFPVAAWTGATLLALAASAGAPAELMTIALYANVVGLVTGTAAVVAGVSEFIALPGDAAVRTLATRHMMLAAGAWTLYLLALVLQVKDAAGAATLIYAIALAVLVVAGHAGARLVYHHGIPRHG